MNDRARQFLPFAALNGYYELIANRTRIKQERREISEEEKENINKTLNALKKGVIVKVVYYKTDAYETMEGILTSIDPVYKNIKLIKTLIPFEDIYAISSEQTKENM